jgi:tetratricopeptide (TPR) repeat protein
VSKFLIGLLAAAAGASLAGAATNVAPRSPAASTNSVVAGDPIEKEYQQIMSDDDAAQAEVDKWITDNRAFVEKGAGASDAELNRRIRERLAPIKQRYEDFIKIHPDHANIRVADGSFLNDLHDEEGAEVQWEKGRQLDPKNPAAWNNLAGIYGEGGNVKKAFEYYTKAIELNPRESL